jgi:hypothetical protein
MAAGEAGRKRTFNARAVAEQLRALDAGEGQTYFQIVMEIIAAHATITLETA